MGFMNFNGTANLWESYMEIWSRISRFINKCNNFYCTKAYLKQCYQNQHYIVFLDMIISQQKEYNVQEDGCCL